jgi:hypothetical protein
VGAAHSFDATRLAEAGEVEFGTRAAAPPVARSQRYWAKPGSAYHLPGSSPREDFVLFALEEPPHGVRLLEPAPPPAAGTRIEIVGLDADGNERTLRGIVEKTGDVSITVELDGVADLRGWGGAPVVLQDGGGLIGLLQAAWPKSDRTSTTIGAIGGATAALAEPYENGLGRLFATLAPPRSAASSLRMRPRDAGEVPLAKLSPDAIAKGLDAVLPRRAAPPPADGPLRVAIESPEPEAIFTDAAGAFVAGRALTGRPAAGRFDVYLVLDTSISAVAPSGADVDGDGTLGTATATQERASSDPGDSILAAECAAAARLVEGLDPKRTRVGILSFAGDPVAPRDVREAVKPRVVRAAQIHEPLTSDFRRVRTALAELAATDPRGMTHMAAGIDFATVELLGLSGAIGRADPDSTKMVLFFTDGQPTLPYANDNRLNVGAVLSAADRANRAGIRIHSFAIGPEAVEGPIAAAEMAAITHGLFTPVPDPARLTEFVDAVLFTAVAEVRVRNATSGADAYEVRLHADGSWEALVPLAVGKNELEVRARSTAGAETAERILVHYAPGSARAALPAE